MSEDKSCEITNLEDSNFENCKMDFQKKQAGKQKEPNLCNINNFERLKTLGTGSFGSVLLVRDKNTSGYLAIKVLSKQKIYQLKQVDHTLSEKKILSSIEHPFIIKLYYSFKDNSNLYLVMEFVNGGEMFNHLRNSTKYEEEQARFYAGQVVLAFEYLHSLKIVYRDLKPENILIDRTGYIKLTDFGFAKMFVTNNRTYTLCGTPEYLAPEILLNRGYSVAIDWWALGVLIYEMTYGFPPFYDNDPLKTYEKILKGKYKTQKSFSEALLSIINELLEKDLSFRLGNLKGGSKDIKNHKWFESFEWLDIINKQIPAPYIPYISEESDTRNFDEFEEKEIESCEFSLYEKEFKDF